MNANFTPKIVKTELFGDFSRFKLIEFFTRFGTTCWMVEDAERMVSGKPEVILQEDSRELAVSKVLDIQGKENLDLHIFDLKKVDG